MALSPQLRGMISKAKNKYSQGGKTIKPKEGRNIYRVIAPAPGTSGVGEDGQFWADSAIHWIKADDKGKPMAVVGDEEFVYQRPSVLNTAIQMAIESAVDEESKKLYESWRSRKSVLLNVVDRSTGQNEILEITATTFGKFLELYEIHLDAGQDLTDPASGVDICLTRTGKGLNTEYSITAQPGVSQPLTADQIKGVKDLNAFIAAEYFSEDNTKALNAVRQIAGIAPPMGNTLGAATPTAALTSAGASVADAAITQPDPNAAALAAQQAAAEQAALAAQQAAAQQAAATQVQPDPTPAPPVETGSGGLSAEEEAALMAELDALGGA